VGGKDKEMGGKDTEMGGQMNIWVVRKEKDGYFNREGWLNKRHGWPIQKMSKLGEMGF
jgi:hypothetical protein